MESTITYNDLLVNNLTDQLPPLTLTAEDSDGDIQAVATLDLNNAKILNNKTINTVTLDVPVPAINLTDVYAKNVTIPLDFQIIPPLLKRFELLRYPQRIVSTPNGSRVNLAAPIMLNSNLTKSDFTLNNNDNLKILENETFDNQNDLLVFIQIGYVHTGFEPGYYRIMLDVVSVYYLISTSDINDGRGYTVYPNNYFYYYHINASEFSDSDRGQRIVLRGLGDIPGIGDSGRYLFVLYDESPYENSNNDDDEAGTYGVNESVTLRISPDVLSLAEWFN